MKKAILLIDGEHYPPVVKAALQKARKHYDVQGLVFLGGMEKIADEVPDTLFGLPLAHTGGRHGLLGALRRFSPDIVLDLSDEPVLDYKERLFLANLAITHNSSYIGADFTFTPPELPVLAQKPTMRVIGTGKRVGKTAVAAYLCRQLKANGWNPVAIAMGRGGPDEPELFKGSEQELSPEVLLRMVQEGKHAASDYLEDAMMSRITTIGCRRCGGGLSGMPYMDNLAAGVIQANELPEDIIVLEGSGSCIPPVYSDSGSVIIDSTQPLEYIAGYFGPYRILKSDIAVLTNCEQPMTSIEKIETLKREIKAINPEIGVITTHFRPKPRESIAGEKVFFATTAPEHASETLAKHLEMQYDCRVVKVSNHLSNRKFLRQDLKEARNSYTMLLTELKAAAVDVVTESGRNLDIPVVYSDNEPHTLEGNLSQAILDLAELARERFNKKNPQNS